MPDVLRPATLRPLPRTTGRQPTRSSTPPASNQEDRRLNLKAKLSGHEEYLGGLSTWLAGDLPAPDSETSAGRLQGLTFRSRSALLPEVINPTLQNRLVVLSVHYPVVPNRLTL